MKKRSPIAMLAIAAAAALAALLIVLPSLAGADRSNQQLIDAHLNAGAECNADAIVDGYAKDATVFFPDGVVVKGRAALQELYEAFLAPRDEGGFCGLQVKQIRTWSSGSTSFVELEVTAPFLAKPYFSTDGYVFEGGKIAAEMSTFDASKLVFTE
jgi:hypothetical protein